MQDRLSRLAPDERRARLYAVVAALRRRFGPHIIRLGGEHPAAGRGASSGRPRHNIGARPATW